MSYQIHSCQKRIPGSCHLQHTQAVFTTAGRINQKTNRLTIPAQTIKPNLTIKILIPDGYIPIVRANMMLRGIDSMQEDGLSSGHSHDLGNWRTTNHDNPGSSYQIGLGDDDPRGKYFTDQAMVWFGCPD